MNDYKNFCEYVIKPVPGAKVRLARALLVSAYSIFAAGYTIIFWGLLGMWTLMLLLPFLIFAFYRLTWRFVDVEYDVSLEAGELTVAKVYGKSSRRVKLRAYVPEMTLIAPYDELTASHLLSKEVDSVTYYTENGVCDKTYICVYPDTKRGRKHAIVIDATDELLRIMRLCNPSLFAGMSIKHK